jgi:hypothetical protein
VDGLAAEPDGVGEAVIGLTSVRGVDDRSVVVGDALGAPPEGGPGVAPVEQAAAPRTITVATATWTAKRMTTVRQDAPTPATRQTPH